MLVGREGWLHACEDERAADPEGWTLADMAAGSLVPSLSLSLALSHTQRHIHTQTFSVFLSLKHTGTHFLFLNIEYRNTGTPEHPEHPEHLF